MKRIVVILLLALLAIVYFRREKVVEWVDNRANDDIELPTDDGQHLIFLGMPIDGSLLEYVEYMRCKGYKEETISEGRACMVGKYEDYKGCTICMESCEANNLLAKITVELPAREQWRKVYADYCKMKELLTNRYGAPTLSIEKMHGMFTDRGTNDSVRLAKFGECYYKTIYCTDRGDVWLQIQCGSVISGINVQVVYQDRINSGISKEQAIAEYGASLSEVIKAKKR